MCLSGGVIASILPITKLSTHHISVGVCPAVVTHCPPLTTVENFQTSFMADCTPYQPNGTVWANREL